MPLAVDREVGLTREVLSQQAIGVLVRTSLPWASRIAEVDLHVGRDGELFVMCHLHATVPGQCCLQLRRKLIDLLRYGVDDLRGVLAADLRQHRVPRLALD